MADRPTPPPFPNVRPQPLALPYSAMGARSRSHWTGIGLVLLAIGGALVATGLANGRVVLTGLGIAILVSGFWSFRRGWRSSEPTTVFEVYEEGLLVDGILRPFSSVVTARRTSAATGILTMKRKSLWLDFDDGSHLGIGYWIGHFAAIQAAVIERLPDKVRARILADSRLVE